MVSLFYCTALVTYTFQAIEVPAENISHVHSPAALETVILNDYPVAAGNFLFMEWAKLRTDDVVVMSDRAAVMASDVCKCFRHINWIKTLIKKTHFSDATAAIKIQQILRSWILEEHKLKAILASSHAERLKVRPTTLVGFPKYDIVISVLNPDPSAQKVHWDVRAAAESNMSTLVIEFDFR